jgi:hypothetical protein
MTLTFTTSSVSGGQPLFNANVINGGTATLNLPSGSITFSNNNINSTVTHSGSVTPFTSRAQFTNNLVVGTTTLNHISSSITSLVNSYLANGTIINNTYFHTGSANNVTFVRNLVVGQDNTINFGGNPTTNVARNAGNSIIAGNNNIVSMEQTGSSVANLGSTLIYGNGLVVTGSHTSVTTGGSTFVGRWNATGSLQDSSQDTVFVVGTGTAAGARRNALRIDSDNNSNFTGSVNISGSLLLNGSTVGPSDRNGLITTGSATTYPTQTINGSLQISSGSLYARGRNTSGNNLAYGELALASITTANSNTGLGNGALQSATTGGGNLAVGGAALSNMTTATNNVGIGNQALLNNISGSNNTAIGANTLQNNVAGFNLAIGIDSLKNNTIGGSNVGIGNNALLNNVSGSNNMAIGAGSLTNVKSNNNTGIGGESLNNLTVGTFNTAIGYQAMANTVSGSNNIAIGNEAGQLITGDNNVGIGFQSIKNITGGQNVGIGTEALQNAGSNNIGIGHSAGRNETGSNNLYISNQSFGSTTNDRSGSLMYGTMSSVTSGQTLQINANTDIRFGLKVSGTTNLTGSLLVSGDVMFSSGSNKTMGTVALDGANPGAATVSNSLVTTSSLIFLTKQTNNHPNAGPVVVSSKGSGTFTITSNHNGDTDTVAYQIINPI